MRKARVLFRDQFAGTLEETTEGGTRFIYDPSWQTPIACSLPVDTREHEWTPGLHPFFQNLGPEGSLRERQARVGQIDEGDDFGLLLTYGADCIGAVGVRPLAGSEATTAAPTTEVTASPGRTISGVQRKLLVVKHGSVFAPAEPTDFAPYIAKFNSESERVGSLIRNENLSLRWAAEILGKDEINTFEIGTVSILNEAALIVTRFDRSPDGGKLRMEDFAQILNRPAPRGGEGKYNASYEEVASVIKRYSARPEIDLARFFRRLVVFVLVGNCDAHLKNFSLLETDTGLRLSPAYDVVNTAFYDGFDQNLALSIEGRRRHLDQVTRDLLVEFAQNIGLSLRFTEQTLDLIHKHAQRAAGILRPPDAEPPDGFVHRFSEIVSRACLRILGD